MESNILLQSPPPSPAFSPTPRTPLPTITPNALRQSLPEFLVNAGKTNIFAKFIGERQDQERFELFSQASPFEHCPVDQCPFSIAR